MFTLQLRWITWKQNGKMKTLIIVAACVSVFLHTHTHTHTHRERERERERERQFHVATALHTQCCSSILRTNI
jgi:hypothetical protein